MNFTVFSLPILIAIALALFSAIAIRIGRENTVKFIASPPGSD